MIINNKNTNCPENELGYEVDCPLKQALKKITNDPGCFKIKKVDFNGIGPMVDPPGKIRNVYGTINIEIELISSYVFDMNGKLVEY